MDKKCKNGFKYFMVEVKNQEEKKGRTFRGMNEVALLATPKWRAKSDREKEHYNELAAYEEDTEELQMRQIIHAAVDIPKEILKRKKFYIIYAHYFYEHGDEYIPAEIAISKFSACDGLIEQYHTAFESGPIPAGYMSACNEHTEETHKMFSNEKNTLPDYKKKCEDIMEFLRDPITGTINPVYTLSDVENGTFKDTLRCAKGVLQYIYEHSGLHNGAWDEVFKVFPVTKLMYAMDIFEVYEKTAAYETLLEKQLLQDSFRCLKNINTCKFHAQIQREEFCSLHISARMTYMVCWLCASFLRCRLVVGRHYPRVCDDHWRFRNRSSRT